MVQITSVSFINIIKCHNHSATVTTSSTGRTRVSRAANVLAGVTPRDFEYRMHLDLCMYTYFYLYADTQDVKRPPRTRHEAPLFLAKNYFYLVFVLAHSSRRPPSPIRRERSQSFLDFSQKLFFTCRILAAVSLLNPLSLQVPGLLLPAKRRKFPRDAAVRIDTCDNERESGRLYE